MSYSFSTRAGQALTIEIPVSVDTTGYTVTVELSGRGDFGSPTTKTPTAAGKKVTLALTKTEVDALGSGYYRVKAVKNGKTSYIQDGRVAYAEGAPTSVATILDTDGKIKAELLPASSGVESIDATNFGLSTVGTGASNKAALLAAFDAAAGGKEVYLPPGVYPVDPGLVWNSTQARLRGTGDQTSILSFTSNSDHGLSVGAGDTPDLQGTQGWIKGIGIHSPQLFNIPARTGKAALQLRSFRFGTIEDVGVRGFDVGFDMVANCFGTDFYNCRVMWDMSNCGIRIQPSLANGNDHNFFNCWFTGKYAAVHIEADSASGSDGFHFYGGQMSGGYGLSADDDTLGAIIIGQNWVTGADSSGEPSRLTLTGTTFEGVHHKWLIRAFQPCDVALTNVGLNLFDGPNRALGLFKSRLQWQDRLALRNTRFGNVYFKTAVFGSGPQTSGVGSGWYEEGTTGFLTVGAGAQVNLNNRGLFDTLGITRGTAIHSGINATFMLDGLRYRNNAGVFEVSTNGTTWSALAPVSPAAGTAGLRVLGAGATNAAPGNDSRFTVLANVTQTGTAYTPTTADARKVIEMNNAAANTVTIPSNATAAFPVGTVIDIYQLGAGVTTIAPAAGVTLRSATSPVVTAGQYAPARRIRKRATDEWVVLV